MIFSSTEIDFARRLPRDPGLRDWLKSVGHAGEAIVIVRPRETADGLSRRVGGDPYFAIEPDPTAEHGYRVHQPAEQEIT